MSDEMKPTGNPMIDAMLRQLVDSGEADKMQGLDLERLTAAMSAPGASETVAEVMELGAGAAAGVGQPAPDFELPYLPGHGGAEGETVRLSDCFTNRPVALIFGSYT